MAASGRVGFSLVEVMIALALVAVLAMLATAGYRVHVLHARRWVAMACLQQQALGMERYYSEHLSYSDSADPPSAPECEGDSIQAYGYRFSRLQADGFTVSARPRGGQREDGCGELWLDQTGRRGAAAEDCWQ